MPRSNIMLCYPFDPLRFTEKWRSKALLQPKYNGERARAIHNANGQVTLLSSQMNQVTGVPHLIRKLQGTHLKNLELDGELYTHRMDKEMIRSIVSRKNDLHPLHETMEYVIFDLVSPKPIQERLEELSKLQPILPEGITIAPTFLVESLDEIEGRVAHFFDDGYEGIVLKQLNGLYERKRSTQWMKLKPRGVDTYLIRGVKEEVDIHGKKKNSLGAFICQTPGEELFRVGSGPLLTRDGRQVLWDIKEALPGMWLQIKYQNLTTDRQVPYSAVACAVLTENEAKEWMENNEKENEEDGTE